MSALNDQKQEQQQSEGYAEGYVETGGSESKFKQIFKFYKKRDAPLNMADVIDPRKLDASPHLQRSRPLPEGVVDPQIISALGLRPLTEWNLCTMEKRKGLYILTDIIEPSHHIQWFDRCLNIYPEFPGLTNVHLHIPDATNIFEKYSKKLRWTTLGRHYDWTTKVYPTSGSDLPSELTSFASLISSVLNLGPIVADAAIINYYPVKATLAPHVDRSERDLARPLISLSLGQSAVYLTGGTDLDDPIDALYLRSGDVLVMHADQRLVYHAVPSVQITQKFEAPNNNFSKKIVDYADSHRISLTLRQVDFH